MVPRLRMGVVVHNHHHHRDEDDEDEDEDGERGVVMSMRIEDLIFSIMTTVAPMTRR